MDSLTLLLAAGLGRGPNDAAQIRTTAMMWEVCMPDVSDRSLHLACVAFLRDTDKAPFWPDPGRIMSYMPSQRKAEDDSEAAWAELIRAVRGVAMLIMYPNQMDNERYSHKDLRLSGSTSRVDAQLGWLDSKGGPRTLVQMEQRGIDFARSDFLKSYRARMGTAAQRIEDRKVLALVSTSHRIEGSQ